MNYLIIDEASKLVIGRGEMPDEDSYELQKVPPGRAKVPLPKGSPLAEVVEGWESLRDTYLADDGQSLERRPSEA